MGDVSPTQKALSAISGAIITSLIVTPLDVVKTRLQSQSLQEPVCCREISMATTCGPQPEICEAEQTSLRRFNGTWEGIVKISRNEGVSSLWRGLSPTLFMAIPSTVIYFVGYEQLRGLVGGDATWAPLLCGGLARTASATAIGPLELLRTRLQSSTHLGKSASQTFKDVSAGMKASLRREGFRSLWRGLGLTLWRDVPFSALYWLGYEKTRRLLSRHDLVHSPFAQSFLSGGVSGTIAALVTTPFDVAKTKKQILEREVTTPQLMRIIYAEEGVRGLWRGTVPRCLKVSPACAIMISSYELGKRFFTSQRPNDRDTTSR
ncbi:Carrier protein, mitochondrial [Savitreella phatthalungensis]